MVKLDAAFVQSLIDNQSDMFKAEIKSLRDEVTSLRAELAALKRDTQPQLQKSSSIPLPTNKHTLEETVTASVKTAFRDEKAKREVVLAQLPENKRDSKDVEALCRRLKVSTRPSSTARMGQATSERPRLLKATFPSEFDARLFLAKVEANNNDNNNADNAPIRCRPCRTRNEQSRYLAVRDKVRRLNNNALENSLNESFSIRHNGDVWRFAKENGNWKRDPSWKISSPQETDDVSESESPEMGSGNGPSSPEH